MKRTFLLTVAFLAAFSTHPPSLMAGDGHSYRVVMPGIARDGSATLVLKFGATVGPDVEFAVRDAEANARTYFLQVFGVEVQSLTVYIDFDGQQLAEDLKLEWLKQHPGGTPPAFAPLADGEGRASPGLIAIRPRSNRPGYFDPGAAANSQRTIYQTVAHEYFHVLQVQTLLSAPGSGGNYGDTPAWLLEGGAEVAGWEAAVNRAGGSIADVLAANRNLALQETRSLAEFRSFAALGNSPQPYQFMYVAAAYLAEHHGGDQALLNFFYWRALLPNADTAFAKTFGIALDGFVEEFDSNRNSH